MRITWKLLLGISLFFIALLIGIMLWQEIKNNIDNTSIVQDVRERTDIIVSDRVPIGCFIPPNIDKDKFEDIIKKSKDVDIESTNKKLFNYCFDSDRKNGFFGAGGLKWENIENSILYGIKLNGYCYSCPECQCLEEEITGWKGEDFLTEQRSLDFGIPDPSSIGKGLDKQSFVEIEGQPSVFVVKKNEEAKLSLYGGIFLRGQKTVEKVTAALYKGTVEESNRISNRVGEGRSCYIGEKWACYKDCSGGGPDCRIKCDCYTEQRYYDEDSLEICEHFCISDDFKEGKASPEEKNDCASGCGIGKKRKDCRDCLARYGNIEDCVGKCNNPDCADILYEISETFIIADEVLCDLRDDSVLTENKKLGCKRFIETEDSTFQIEPMEYAIFKIGDIELTDKNYRGLAWAVATITTKEPRIGISCYSPDKYSDYRMCCDEFCKYTDKGCRDETSSCVGKGIELFGLPTNCEIATDCNTISRTGIEDPRVLCRTFCGSRDGFYGDSEKTENCRDGCETAEKGDEPKDDISKVGFNKYNDLIENTVPVDNPYVWKEVYKEVFSNLIYIVDWDDSGGEWTYPCRGDWGKICTPELDKSVESDLLDEIKGIY